LEWHPRAEAWLPRPPAAVLSAELHAEDSLHSSLQAQGGLASARVPHRAAVAFSEHHLEAAASDLWLRVHPAASLARLPARAPAFLDQRSLALGEPSELVRPLLVPVYSVQASPRAQLAPSVQVPAPVRVCLAPVRLQAVVHSAASARPLVEHLAPHRARLAEPLVSAPAQAGSLGLLQALAAQALEHLQVLLVAVVWLVDLRLRNTENA